MRGFGSDNHSGVHPALLKAIADCNVDHAPSYGTDRWTAEAIEAMRELLGKPDAGIYFVFNGTAANTLSLRAGVQSFNSVFCSEVSHLNQDECGAPEFLTGSKLLPLPSQNGILDLTELKKHLIRRGDQHYSQAKLLSITQPTELGTCYSLEQIKELTHWAHQNDLYVHLDGARLANAVVSLNSSFKEMICDTGIDVLSWGGTKNGLLFGEAVVILNPKLEQNFSFIRKQFCQLPSKSRFIAAQFQAYCTNTLWKEISLHSLKMAALLYQQVEKIKGVEITRPQQSNVVFAQIPQPWVKALREKYFFYVWDEKTFECRWMTSWDTTEKDIQGFAQELKKLSTQHFGN